MDALEECHSQVASLLGSGAEPIEVLRRAEEHRAFWRPDPVRIVLLAESHVYTARSELERRIILDDLIQGGVPCGFVRLVYCLGYGEEVALDRNITVPRNSGTPQFWKIFYSCVNPVNTNADFAPIQVSRTPCFAERIRNKLALLERLKELGVWLVDASLAALYLPGHAKPSPRLVADCIQTCWRAYIERLLVAARPLRIVCIGRGVERALDGRLSGLGVPVTVVPQPNARLASTEHLAVLQRYHEIVRQAQQG
jgi:hypothetical protein